jgi:hypothetical protein
MAYGTKLLYFAGYRTAHSPRPLVLDARVRRSLVDLTKRQQWSEIVPPQPQMVWRDSYLRYLNVAECWAEAMSVDDSDVVEFGLFEPKIPRSDPDAESGDGDARGGPRPDGG